MTIAQRGAAGNGGSTSGSLSLTKPSGLVVGDLLVVFLTSNNQTSTVPSGWTNLFNVEAGANPYGLECYYKVATSTETAASTFAFSNTGGAPYVGTVVAFSGIDTTNPIAANATSNFSTDQTEPVTTPTATNAAGAGRCLYIRSARNTDTSAPTPLTWSTAAGGVTELADTGQLGTGTVSYSHGLYFDNADFTTGGNRSGIGITATGSFQDTYQVLATVVLRTLVDSTWTSTLGNASFVDGGNSTVHDDATMDCQLGSATFDGAGIGGPPSGVLATTLGNVTADIAGVNDTGGTITSSLGNITSSMTGSVNPVGTWASSLGHVTCGFELETRPFGEQVIIIEAEQRGVRVINDDPGVIWILPSEVDYEPLVASIGLTLSSVTSTFAGATIGGDWTSQLGNVSCDFEVTAVDPADMADVLGNVTCDFEVTANDNATMSVTLGSVTCDFEAQEIYGTADVTLGNVTSDFEVTANDNADMPLTLGNVTCDFEGGIESSGAAAMTLGNVTCDFEAQEIYGDLTSQLGSVTCDIEAGAIYGPADMTLGNVTANFTGDDLMKYITAIGDGSTLSYTVTHSFGSRDVVVGIYDATTFEEVLVTSVTHTTTNTVTIVFPVAPATNAYQVVVLYSA